MFCKNCGTRNDDGAKLCVNCGAAMEQPEGVAEHAGAAATAPIATATNPKTQNTKAMRVLLPLLIAAGLVVAICAITASLTKPERAVKTTSPRLWRKITARFMTA